MEAYKSETQTIIERFLFRQITFPECISALDTALTNLIPRLKGEHIASLRAHILDNNTLIMQEMERRGPPPSPG